MGRLAAKLGLKFQELNSVVIGSVAELQATDDSVLISNYHFRVKSGSLNSRNDVKIMLALHKRMLDLKSR